MILLKHDWNSFIFEASDTPLAVETGYVEHIKVTFDSPDNYSMQGEDNRIVSFLELSERDRIDLAKDITKFSKGDT